MNGSSTTNSISLLDEELLVPDKLLSAVVDHYLSDDRFSGVYISDFMSSKKTPLDDIGIRYLVVGEYEKEYIENKSYKDLVVVIEGLIRSNKLALIPSDCYPHSNRVGFPTMEKQCQTLQGEYSPSAALYPTGEVLANAFDREKYVNTPFKLRLALGNPQLSFVYFRLDVLEEYRLDPRYEYSNNDIEGEVYVREEFMSSVGRDTYLKMFTFAINENTKRVVAVFLKDLAYLESSEQQRWLSFEASGNYQPHPDFCKRYLVGKWGTGISICSAVLLEISAINRICEQAGREKLFINDIDEHLSNAPKDFALLLRSTKRSYDEFVTLLEKLVCTMNCKFFTPDVSTHKEVTDTNGKPSKLPKGTIIILDEWVRLMYPRAYVDALKSEVIDVLRDIRKMRQVPAHKIVEDNFDEQYILGQRTLLERTRNMLFILRNVLADLPNVDVSSIKSISTLEKSDIWPI